MWINTPSLTPIETTWKKQNNQDSSRNNHTKDNASKQKIFATLLETRDLKEQVGGNIDNLQNLSEPKINHYLHYVLHLTPDERKSVVQWIIDKKLPSENPILKSSFVEPISWVYVPKSKVWGGIFDEAREYGEALTALWMENGTPEDFKKRLEELNALDEAKYQSSLDETEWFLKQGNYEQVIKSADVIIISIQKAIALAKITPKMKLNMTWSKIDAVYRMFYYKGIALKQLGKFNEAKDAFTTKIENVLPKQPYLIHWLCSLYLQTWNFSEAKKSINELALSMEANNWLDTKGKTEGYKSLSELYRDLEKIAPSPIERELALQKATEFWGKSEKINEILSLKDLNGKIPMEAIFSNPISGKEEKCTVIRIIGWKDNQVTIKTDWDPLSESLINIKYLKKI